MRATGRLAETLGWLSTILLALIVLVVVSAAELRVIEVPWLDFVLAILQATGLAWVLFFAWSERRAELRAHVAGGHHVHAKPPVARQRDPALRFVAVVVPLAVLL